MREGGITLAGERQARDVLHKFASTWLEIQPTNSLRAVAERLLGVHALRAADAFQLAAALQWCRGETSGMGLICFDGRLRSAAHREGLTFSRANRIPGFKTRNVDRFFVVPNRLNRLDCANGLAPLWQKGLHSASPAYRPVNAKAEKMLAAELLNAPRSLGHCPGDM
jgi:hypothetical protein